MRPDLAKFRRFCTIYVVILSVFKYLEPALENLEPSLANLYTIGQINIAVNKNMLNK